MKKAAAALLLLAVVAWAVVSSGGPPVQPIAFSHKKHAGERGIACTLCHVGARTGARASIPNTQACLGCHALLPRDNAEIQKIFRFAARGDLIPWKRVYLVRSDNRFHHGAHARAGIDCSRCHGDVAHADSMEVEVGISMARCVACHEENSAPTDCWTCHKG